MSDFKKYKCKMCGHVYDEEKGDARTGIAPGTLWADVPEDWECPECGAVKIMFKVIRE
jgi:rubredoxin